MTEPMRNEFPITLGETTYTMRATFAALRAIERDLKSNLVPLISKMAQGDFGVEQAATIIFHGLRGYGDQSLKMEQVGDLVMETGLDVVMMPVVNFLSFGMQGVSLGKPQATETAPA